MKIDISEHFETSSISDVAYAAMLTFSEMENVDLSYLHDVYEQLNAEKHWLLQLNWCHEKMDNQNFFTLCKSLNYDSTELNQAFNVIKRKSRR